MTMLACSEKKAEPAKAEDQSIKQASAQAPEDSVEAKFAVMEEPEPVNAGEGCGDVFSKDDMQKETKEGNPYGGVESYHTIGLDAKHIFNLNLMHFSGKLGLMIMLVHEKEQCIKGKADNAAAVVKFADGSYYKLKAVNEGNCGNATSVTDSSGAVGIFEIPMNSTFFKRALEDEISYIAVESTNGIVMSKFVTTDGPVKFRNGFRCAFDAFDRPYSLNDTSKLIDNKVALKKKQQN
jgi:hypothetical protein